MRVAKKHRGPGREWQRRERVEKRLLKEQHNYTIMHTDTDRSSNCADDKEEKDVGERSGRTKMRNRW